MRDQRQIHPRREDGGLACDGGGLQWPRIVVQPWWLGDGVPPWVLGLKVREQNKREKAKRERLK